MTMLLQAKAIGVSRGGNELFAGLDLVIESQDRLGLVGHNGSGKSTLLRVLAGQLAVDDGDLIRKRNLALECVEQFLPRELEGVSMREAVARKVAVGESWRADALLSELGFAEDELERNVSEFSGGQQNRLMLARALVTQPDLLLLDEPTNHLDLETLLVFESILGRFPGALVLVSHDRDFLDAVTNTTFLLRDARGYRFSSAYTDAMSALAEMDEAHARTRAAEERKIAALKQSAKKLAEWGRVYDNEKFARRARSMERRVDRLEEEKTFVSRGSGLELELELGQTRSKQALVLEDFSVRVPGKMLYHVPELIVRPGDRVALLGANGAGKTTLIREIIGAYRKLRESGETYPAIRFSPQTEIGYYDQELDEVSAGAAAVSTGMADSLAQESMLAFVCRRVESPERTVRARLIRAGFDHQDHGKRITALSGGERARLLFLIHALNRPNFLILDEPTNHIDIAGKEQLEEELLASSATLLITSHDRRFLNHLANRFLWIRDGELLEVPDPQAFYRHSGEGFSDAPAPVGSAVSEPLPPSGAAGDHGTAADQVLERIVELEGKLEADRARKHKFQKPELQQRWQQELQDLYAKLD